MSAKACYRQLTVLEVEPNESLTRQRKTEGAPARNQIAIKESKIIQP
jgi:hypothetical protein